MAPFRIGTYLYSCMSELPCRTHLYSICALVSVSWQRKRQRAIPDALIHTAVRSWHTLSARMRRDLRRSARGKGRGSWLVCVMKRNKRQKGAN